MTVIQYCMTRQVKLLKAALDSSKKRKISWNTDSAHYVEKVSDTFEFKGPDLLLTKFDKVRGKLKDYLIICVASI